MCRVIGVFCYGGNPDKDLICKVSKLLGVNKKVCVFDAEFGLNCISYMFEPLPTIDFKDYLIGQSMFEMSTNKINRNLFVVKTSVKNFDYDKYYADIQNYIGKLKGDFDYIFVVSCMHKSWMIDIFSEVLIAIDNEISSIRYAKNVLQKLWNKNNIKNLSLVLNNHKVIKELKGKLCSANEIGKITNLKILITIPKLKFYKNCESVATKKLAYSIEHNIESDFDYKYKYHGIVGYFRRKMYEKFE